MQKTYASLISDYENGNTADFKEAVSKLTKLELLELFLSLHDNWTDHEIMVFIYKCKLQLEKK